MEEIKKRRTFLKFLAPLALLPFGWLWFSMVEKDKKANSSANAKVEIPMDVAQGVTFLNEVIVVQQGDFITVFLAKCPHMGCKINSIEDGNLLCPCHGSLFSLKGAVLLGPAVKPLKELQSTLDVQNKKIVVYLS